MVGRGIGASGGGDPAMVVGSVERGGDEREQPPNHGSRVWSLVRRFDQPQKYKPFVSRCCVVQGDLEIGSVRENYSSVITVHPEIIDGRPGTLVIESFVVDVPDGNTKDETCYFVEALIKCNLKSLADVSERLAVQDRTEPIR
ncbi:uncharacterized protein A4U43_C05F27000 [Asparagus officinalis]|uniref:Uncharacterized protein n=1 Tax=Asparagus officinalis TaxID=4686 RepID=A0A5P1EUZ3_ASPOF|nr:uncharacterized protein A4U43_C05F27000 [Asparagus officinalis]